MKLSGQMVREMDQGVSARGHSVCNLIDGLSGGDLTSFAAHPKPVIPS